MLHLTSVKIRNFGLIRDSSVSIAPNDFTFITGEHLSGEMGTLSIGSGKTTFLTAIWWGLTNELIYKSRDYLASDIIGPFGKAAEVELTLESGETIYKIARKRSASGYSVTLLENNTDLTSKDNTGTELLIQEKVGVNWEVFRYSNYIPQEDSKTGFLYASEKQRRQLVTQLYHQQFFDHMFLAFKEIRQGLDRELVTKQQAISLLEGQIQQAELQASQLDTELNEIKLNNLKVSNALPTSHSPDFILAKIDERKLAIARAKKNQDLYREEAREATERASSASVEAASLEVEAEGVRGTQEAILGRLSDMKSQLRTRGFCPLCRTQMTEQAMIAIKKACNKEIKSYKLADIRLLHLNQARETLLAKIETAKEERQKFKDKVTRIDSNLERHERKIGHLELDLKKIYENQKQYIDPGPIERALDAANESLRTLHKQIVELEWQVGVAQKKAKRYAIWEEAYNSTIRAMAFESVIDRFSMLVGQKLALMYGDNMQIRFDAKKTKADNTVSDKFTIQIKDKDMGSWKGVVFASGGQKRIISLAIAMSMMELSQPQLALYLIDEGLEGVDPNVARNALGAIREMSKSLSVLFVTHQGNIASGERRIVAVRQDGCVNIQ